MAKRPIKVKDKFKGKEWFEILAPKFLDEKFLGETPALDAEMVKGRVVESNPIELMNNPSKYYIKLFFMVTDVKGKKAYTKFVGHDCTRDFVARVVQKRTNKVESNDKIEFSDGILEIKTLTICNRRVHKSIETKIRKTVRERMAGFKKIKIETFVKDMLSGKAQQEIIKDLKKIYPIRVFEFQKSELIK